MLHYYISNDGAHYAVKENCLKDAVLVQLQDDWGTQVRVQLTPEQAKHVIDLIQDSLRTIKEKVFD